MPPIERPLCQCHGKPMFWHKDSRQRSGGYWNCPVKKKACDETYRKTEKGHKGSLAIKRRSDRKRATEQDRETVNRILSENPWLEELNHGKTVGTEGRERAVA